MSSSSDPGTPAPMSPRRWRGHGGRLLLVLLGLLGAGLLVWCELQGWPFLQGAAERWLSQRLDRVVSFEGAVEGQGKATTARWRLHLLGGIRLETPHLRIGAPAWSTLGPTLQASNARVRLRYRDLLALDQGQVLRIESLQLDTLALNIERQAEDRASWQFGRAAPGAAAQRPAIAGIHFGHLLVRQGTAAVNDKLSRLEMVARFSLQEGAAELPDAADAAASAAASAASAAGIRAKAEGRYREMPLSASLSTGSALPWLSSDPKAPTVPLVLRVNLGRASLVFDGQVRDLLARQGLTGKYQISGPSLAAVGAPLGLTLPTTRAFAARGSLNRDGSRWSTTVEQATIGRSRLAGDFVFDKPAGVMPRLSGELRGSILWLADLGPAIGVPIDSQAPPSSRPARVLPDRAFDLPSLRAMNADVQIRLDKLESGSSLLQAVQPLQAHLLLQDGVLLLDAIDARLAQGRIAGRLMFDGRAEQALWETQLHISGLRIEQWLRLQPRPNGAPPYATGRLGGRLDLVGRGRSTAELLASANGRTALFWTHGTVSHLLVEAAGIDLAQSLGVLLRGDDALPVSCGVADLKIRQGLVTPQLMLVDTRDSTIRLEGSMSLASERLALQARVLPKDISPLALRTPLRIGGTLGDPSLSLEKAPLLQRLLPALVLATLNPLAGLLPLIDLGDEETRSALAECQAAMLKNRGK